jgi:hypothetical protein
MTKANESADIENTMTLKDRCFGSGKLIRAWELMELFME